METPKTLQAAIQHFGDYENCRKFMIAVRWLDEIVRCPRCNSEKVTYLAKARLYRCYGDHPKQKFSLKVGTVFEDSPIALEKWLPAVWLVVNCKNGISSYELHRALGVFPCPKTNKKVVVSQVYYYPNLMLHVPTSQVFADFFRDALNFAKADSGIKVVSRSSRDFIPQHYEVPVFTPGLRG